MGCRGKKRGGGRDREAEKAKEKCLQRRKNDEKGKREKRN